MAVEAAASQLPAWLQPCFDARRKVIDWVAATRLEAHLMLLGALGLTRDRGRHGTGGSTITPSRATPAVMIIRDELASFVHAARTPPEKLVHGYRQIAAEPAAQAAVT